MPPDHATLGPETAPPLPSPARERAPATSAAAPATSVVAPGTSAAWVLDLQRQAGNAAVAELLAGAPRASSPAKGSAALPTIQREPQGPNEAKYKADLPDGYEEMNEGEKVNAIRGLLGSASASVIGRAWSRLSAPLETARANPELFTASVKKSSAVADLPPFATMKEQFEAAVLGRARGYLDTNKAAVLAERERTGVGGPVGETVGEQIQSRVQILAGKGSSAATDMEVQKVQNAAERMEKVKACRAAMLNTQVGWEMKGKGDTKDQYPVMFHPGSPPSNEVQPSSPSYEAVMAEWRNTDKEESKLVKASPSAAFFLGTGGDPAKIGKGQDVRVARAEIAVALTDLQKKIEAAIPKVGDGIEFADLVPIQQELLAGPVWSKPVEQAVAKEATSDGDVAKLLKTLAVSSLSAAAFLFAPLTAGSSAGLATFLFAVGAAASGVQAVTSWEKYADLAAAHRASIDPTEQLVSPEQVDEALTSAVLDTIFAVVDVWQGAKGVKEAAKVFSAAEKGREAIKVGEAVGAAAALRNIQAGPNRAAALAAAIAEVGPEEARRLSGLDYKQLAAIAGEGSELGKRLLALAGAGGVMSEETAALISRLPKVAAASADEGEKILAAGISQFGCKGVLEKVGGWAALKASAVMKGGSGSAAALEAWRSGIAKELDTFVTAASDKLSRAVRTGSELPKSDLDVQILGDAAAQLQKQAEGWLAGRLGTNVDGAKKLLDVTLFIDPTRAHLVDLMRDLGEDVRAQIRSEMAGFEPPLILAARLEAARSLGQDAVDRVLREAPAGIHPATGFKRLSVAEQQRYAVMIDEWMKDLKDPAKVEFKADRVRKIAQTQALINASHADAYVGGGVAIWVTGREMDAAKMAEGLKSLNIDPADIGKFTFAQRISAALSEGKWIDKALHSLRIPGGNNIDQLVRSIIDIGKHGERAASVLRVGGTTNVGRLTELMEKLGALGMIDRRLLREVVTPDELAATRSTIVGILDSLAGETSTAVTALQEGAGALKIDLGQIAEFQDWLRWRDGYRQYSKAAAGGVATIETGLRAMLEEQEREAREGVPANPQPEPATPTPTAPTAPAPTAP